MMNAERRMQNAEPHLEPSPSPSRWNKIKRNTKHRARERLCWVSRICGCDFGVPCFSFADHGVEDGEQLAHAGDHHDFEGFTGMLETLSEGANDAVAAAGRGLPVRMRSTDRRIDEVVIAFC